MRYDKSKSFYKQSKNPEKSSSNHERFEALKPFKNHMNKF